MGGEEDFWQWEDPHSNLLKENHSTQSVSIPLADFKQQSSDKAKSHEQMIPSFVCN